MAIHEPCDILLAISKQFYYRSANKFYINMAFSIFAFSWVYLRILVLALVLYEIWHNPTFLLHDHMLYCSYFLYMLWVMHMIWWVKIVRVMIKGWGGKSMPDARHDGFTMKAGSIKDSHKEM